MAASTLQLLGPFLLGQGVAARHVHLGRKGQALLTCIAAHGAAGASRSALIALLWADHDDDNARNALRQCLHQIRRSAGPAEFIEADADRLVLHAHDCETDLWQFESLAARADTAGLLQAATLYRGPLAEGLAVGRDFDRWLANERERVRSIAQHVVALLAVQASGSQECEASIAFARILLAEDPLHEGCWRALMQLHVRLGLRAKAVQLWQECRSVLRSELDVEPCLQTQALYERLVERS